jgi:hypothetical protein
VLEVQPIGVTDNFFDLGATSVGAARLFTEIERTIGGALPLAPLFIAPTVERLARLIAAHSATGSGAHRFTSLVTIQPSGPRTPIFCVHGGVGTILHFGRLARYLGNDQPFYGLQMQGLEGGQPLHMSVRAMARHYVREITTLQPRGPYVIAGYCFGAIVAQEMARLLSSTGESVPLLMSFNGPSSSYIRRRERRGTSRERLAREWCKLRWAGRMIKGRAWATLGHRFDDNTLRGTIVAITHYVERQYRAMPWHGPMVVAQSATLFSEDGIGWRDVDGIQVETHVSQTWGDDARFLMVEPAVSWLADVVRDAVDRYAGSATAARH